MEIVKNMKNNHSIVGEAGRGELLLSGLSRIRLNSAYWCSLGFCSQSGLDRGRSGESGWFSSNYELQKATQHFAADLEAISADKNQAVCLARNRLLFPQLCWSLDSRISAWPLTHLFQEVPH